MTALIDVRDATFEAEVLRSDIPVLVDFWAPWCAPCKTLNPLLAEIAAEQRGLLKVVKVNIDEEQEYAARLRVVMAPTLMLFLGGELVDRAHGAVRRPAIVEMLAAHLGVAPAVAVGD